MSSRRFVAQVAITLILALPLSACLIDSETADGQNQNDSAAASGLSLSIKSPTSAGSMDTTDSSVRLGGSAASDRGVSQVTWHNDQGGEGSASGTTEWQTSDIALELGKNAITVTAADIDGNERSRNIVVNRESGQQGSATLSWVPPTSRTDGTPLNDLAGYTIYYGRMAETYDYRIDIDNPGLVTYVVEGLSSGDWHFAMSAFDSEGMESERSNDVLRTIM